MRSSLRRGLFVALSCSILVTTPMGAAYAANGPSVLPGAVAPLGLTSVPPGAMKRVAIVAQATGTAKIDPDTGRPVFIPLSTDISKSQFESARKISRSRPMSAYDARLKGKFLSDAAQYLGHTYLPSDVDAVDVTDGISLIAPTSATVT